jgi:hypothetical protein
MMTWKYSYIKYWPWPICNMIELQTIDNRSMARCTSTQILCLTLFCLWWLMTLLTWFHASGTSFLVLSSVCFHVRTDVGVHLGISVGGLRRSIGRSRKICGYCVGSPLALLLRLLQLLPRNAILLTIYLLLVIKPHCADFHCFRCCFACNYYHITNHSHHLRREA